MSLKAFPDKNKPTDVKFKYMGNLAYGYGVQLIKPVVGIGAVSTVIDMYKKDPMAATMFASIGLLSYWTVNMLKTDFAKGMLGQTKLSEWDAVTYSQKHFKDQEWNKRYHPSVGPSMSAANMYNYFAIKHNVVMDFFKFDTLVNFGIKAAIKFSNKHDELFQRFQAASRELGLWNKFNKYIDPIRNVVPANKTTFNIFEQIKEIAPDIEGFISDDLAGPRDDLYKFNDDLIKTSSSKYILNNTYLSFATLQAEIITAINEGDLKEIERLSCHKGIGKFINLYEHTGNENFKAISDMSKSLLEVMDNYRPGDTYHFPLAKGFDSKNSIKNNSQIIFDNLKDLLKDHYDLKVEMPVKFPEEIFRQMEPVMKKFLIKNEMDKAHSDAKGLDAKRMEQEIFPKTEEATKKFIRRMEDKFSIDISV